MFFFVLSGYLISGLLINEYELTGHIQFLTFISRRLKRLLPALALMLSITMLVSPLLISSHELDQQFRSVFFAATWTSNLFFAFSKLDYFAELQSKDFYLHTWSLGVEEQFYIVWPLLLTLVFKWPNKKWLNQNNSQSRFFWFFCFLFISSLFLCIYWSNSHPFWSFYLMPSRIWQFALGASIFAWNRRLTETNSGSLTSSWFIALEMLGLGLIIGSAVLLDDKISYPSFWALFPSVGAALIIIATGKNTQIYSRRLLSNPILVWLGDRSYSWYLWHWPVFMFGFAWGAQKDFFVVVSIILFSLGLAMLSYRWLELPFWKGKYSFAPPPKTIFVSIMTVAMLVIGSLKLFNSVSEEFGKRNIPYNNARRDVPSIYYAFPEGCDIWYANAKVQPCVLGDNNAPKTVVMIGDSVGVMWASMLPKIFKSPRWRVVVLTKSASPMVDRDFYYERIKSNYTVCTAWRSAAIDYIKSLHPEVIITGGAATYPFSKDQWVEGSKSVASQLTDAAKHVIVILGVPELSFDGPSCLARWNADGPGIFVSWLARLGIKVTSPEQFSCKEKLTAIQYEEANQYLKLATKDFPNVHLLELADLVCPDGICSAQNSEKVIVFRDTKHLTDSFVLSQVPKIVTKINKFGLEDADK